MNERNKWSDRIEGLSTLVLFGARPGPWERQFTYEGWEEFVGFCREALNKAFDGDEWQNLVDGKIALMEKSSQQDSLKLKVLRHLWSVINGVSTQEHDNFGREIATADLIEFDGSLPISMAPYGEETQKRLSNSLSILDQKLQERFPQAFADGKKPVFCPPLHTRDFKK